MIGMFLLKLNALAKAVPWQVWALLFALAVAWLWGNSRYNDGVDDTRAEYARAAAQAVENARKADAAGVGKADAGKTAVEVGNAKAREAARGSADPLKAGLDAIEKETGR